MLKRVLALALLLSVFSGCSGSSSDDGDDSEDTGGQEVSCGGVADVTRLTPVELEGVPSNNVVILRKADGTLILVRLLGLSNEPAAKVEAAKAAINTFALFGLYYQPANCEESLPDGGRAAVGYVFNSAGSSLAETLAATGLVLPNPNDSCDGGEYGRCLEGIAAQSPQTAGELDRFLWKPVADSDGKLAIHTGPFGTTVIVNGETGSNRGPGNSYGSLARFLKTGCAYPSPRIEVLAADGAPYTVGGSTTFSVPNPCDRWCIEGGNGVVFNCRK